MILNVIKKNAIFVLNFLIAFIKENNSKTCDPSCLDCVVLATSSCLSCYPKSQNPNYAYLYNKKCYSNCPEGTYPISQSDGSYKCYDCYQNCKTCSQGGDKLIWNVIHVQQII